jgi:predicted NBD/HSP70 family sugar kinase
MKKPVSPFQLREVMDEAVRRLAISTASMQERLQSAAVVVIGALSSGDFESEEERELFEQIQEAVGAYAIDTGSGRMVARSDMALEKLASDILDLRDTIMGRSLREARMSTPHYRRRSSP